jgi:hypothetical protein
MPPGLWPSTAAQRPGRSTPRRTLRACAWAVTVPRATRCGEGGEMSTIKARATRWARGGKWGLTDSSRRWRGGGGRWCGGARSTVRRYVGRRHPRGGSTVGRGEVEVRHAGEMEGDDSRAVLTEAWCTAVVLSATPTRRGFSGGRARTRG